MAVPSFRKVPTFAIDLMCDKRLTWVEARVYLYLVRMARYTDSPRRVNTTAKHIGEGIGAHRVEVAKAIGSLAAASSLRPALIEYRPGCNQYAVSEFTIIESEVLVVPDLQPQGDEDLQPTCAQDLQADLQAQAPVPAETPRRGCRGLRGDSLQESPSKGEEGNAGTAHGPKAAPPSLEEQIASLEVERGLGPFEPWQRDKLASVDATQLRGIIVRVRTLTALGGSHKPLLTEILERVDRLSDPGAA